MPVRTALLACVVLVATAGTSAAQSYYPVKLDDPKAASVDAFGARGDGVADDTDAIQRAIDKVQETVGQGVVFVPEGRYRVTRTVNVWPAIRVVGVGATRPVLLLGARTPGYQDPNAEHYMVFFAGSRPARPLAPGTRPPDSNAGTFYSALSNVDIEIAEGNEGAVGVRGTYAQHCFIAHAEFRVGTALAGVHDTGNVMEDVRFVGGRYGIWTKTPSPGWQFVAVDVSFDGQREAAIRETAAGLTMIRPAFRRVPTAITIDAGSPDELWIRDGRFEDISGPAIVVSLERNARTEINAEQAVCRRVPTFALFRESGKVVRGPAEIYGVATFSHGLRIADVGGQGAIGDQFDAAPLSTMPEPVPTDIAALPPADTWVNIRSLGAKGDGATDDTEVFKRAIASHRAIYLPSGYYVVSDTLTLKPDTVLIGLHPLATQIDLLDRTPAFQGIGEPKALIDAPKGGTNVIVGIGLYTNGINPRAVAALWRAGAASMMNDVRFLGGHGTNNLDGSRANPYNNVRSADPDPNRRWDGQYPSLWVTDGGGGTFLDVWTPSTFAQVGMLVSDTTTAGRVYGLSVEHHVRHEVQLRNVSNWRIYALQTEEERGEGGFALPLDIVGSRNVTIANFHIYRVISSFQPFPCAVRVAGSQDVRFRNVHAYSNSKVAFDATVCGENGTETREREFAWLTVSAAPRALAARKPSSVLAPGASVEKLAGGYFNISGGAVDPHGRYYFVDAHWQRIYRWSDTGRRVETVRDAPLDPVNLAFDKAGNLMVVSYAGNGIVYAVKPDEPGAALVRIEPADAAPRPGLTVVHPVGDWHLRREAATGLPTARPVHYLCPDRSCFISSGRDFASGATSWGVKSADLLRSFGLQTVTPGVPFYLTSEADIVTWRAVAGPDGNITTFEPFVQQGGEGVAVDAAGRVYIAAGDIHVYDPAGTLIETIRVPERPTQIAFGGADRRTLFIAARSSLYAVKTKTAGR